MRQITLSMLMFLPWTVQAGVIVQQEWESMPASNGAPWLFSAGRPDRDCAPQGGSSPSGGCALRMSYDAQTTNTSVSGGIAQYVFQGSYSEIYAGHWLKFSSPYSWNSIANKVDYVMTDVNGDAHTSHSFRTGTGGYGVNGEDTSNPASQMWTCNVFCGSFSPGQWYWFELHFKQSNPGGTSNGVLEVWVNDVLWASFTNRILNTTSLPIGSFYHSPEWGGGGGTIAQNQYIWYDHTVISTTRIGMPGGAAPTGDTQAPSVPAGLSAQATSSSQINLSWSAANDNIGVTGYRIFRGGSQIATAAGTSYSDTGLTASTAYTYTVAAYDAAGNVSAQSSAASATTPAAAGTPGAVTGLSASAAGASGVNLTFTQVSDGTGQPAKYAVRYSSANQLWGGAPDVTQGTCASPLQGTVLSGSLSCTVLGLAASTDYQFQLVPYRGTLNAGAVFGPLSNVAGARTAAAQPAADVQPPAKPRNMRVQ